MKPSITVVALGPGEPELLTLAAAEKLKSAQALIFRTAHHPVAPWLQQQGIPYKNLDALYDRCEDFDELHASMARMLWKKAAEVPVTFAVPDPTTDGAVRCLKQTIPTDGEMQVVAGVTLADYALSRLPVSMEKGGIRLLPAMDCEKASLDPSLPLLVTEIDKAVLAGDVKLWLSDLYDDEQPVWFFPSTVNGEGSPVQLPLWALDRQKVFDHTVCLYVPPVSLEERKRWDLPDLVAIMERLRAPGGCPWDRQQTHESLRKYLLEECYEACGAIDDEDTDHLFDELGDVLLQIVFHASIGKQFDEFTLRDVTSSICGKMISRHSHVFGTDTCQTAEDVSITWEKNKQQEKHLTTQGEALADVCKALPALLRAAKVQKKAAKVGFDWNNALEALPKIHEEADEVLTELQQHADPELELGDLLFSVVNVARLAGVDPEVALTKATEKFIRRFSAMENCILGAKKTLEGLTLSEMDVYWNAVKQAEKEALD